MSTKLFAGVVIEDLSDATEDTRLERVRRLLPVEDIGLFSKHGPMFIRTILLTPEKAKILLALNADYQRSFDSEKGHMFLRTLEEGLWQSETHQGIALFKEGFMGDGQHRAWAVAKSGIAILVSVAFNASSASYPVIDGTGRTIKDRLAAFANEQNIKGGVEKLTSRFISTVSWMSSSLDPEEIDKTPRRFRSRTTPEIIRALEEHMEAIQFVIKHQGKHQKYIHTAPVLAAAAIAYEKEPAHRELLKRALEVFNSGVMKYTHEEGLVRFRNLLMGFQGRVSAADRKVIFYKTQKILSLYFRGKFPKRLEIAVHDANVYSWRFAS